MPRVIYSLHLDCERVPGEPITAFVVNLDRQGNGVPGGIRPIGKARVVDLRVGDWFLHKPTGKKYKLAGISAYRQHRLTEEQVAAGDIPKDGYCSEQMNDHEENPYAAPQTVSVGAAPIRMGFRLMVAGHNSRSHSPAGDAAAGRRGGGPNNVSR